jgi:hypothetical protein
VQPNASRNEIAGCDGDLLRIRLAAPPVEGKANAALIAYLAKALRVRKSNIRLIRGQAGREKTLNVEGLTADELRRRIEEACAAGQRSS